MTADVGRHVLIVTTEGSFTVTGRRLSGPVDTAGKLGKLILWAAHKLGGLQPIPRSADQPDPARVWVSGSAVALLTSESDDHTGAPIQRLGQGLAPLVDEGWELRGGTGPAVVLAHGRGPQRVVVEVLAERQPWLAAGEVSIADDAAELGRRLGRWYAELGVLPGSGGAVSGAVLADHVMASRAGRRGAVVCAPGALPAWATPELRIQPAWSATAEQAEHEFRHCDELMCLTQLSPALASAGMLTFGSGRSQGLDADAAVAAAAGPKRPFGLWLVDLPAGDDLRLPAALPLPHPQMANGHRVQAWVTTEDLDGLAKDIRDGGAGLSVEQLAIAEAIIWPQKARLLEAWATRMREAREAFAGDAPLLALVDAAANDYLTALADPNIWAEETMRHHFQPAWAAAIATHIRLRGRRAAMRISREYQAWPLFIEGTSMVYGPSAPRGTDAPVDLSDSHTRLGRLVTTARAGLTENTILAMLLAESTDEVRVALTAALGLPAVSAQQPEPGIARAVPAPEVTNSAVADSEPKTQDDPHSAARGTENAEESAPVERGQQNPVKDAFGPRRRSTRDAQSPRLGGPPAAVLHLDGLWMPDGTKRDLPHPVTHVGHVAELAYTHNLGYQLTPGYAEPGQIWITEEACRAFGIDVDTALEKKPKDRDAVLREITQDIPFVAEALADGWKLGGGANGAGARLGTWTRVYPTDQRRKGVWVVLMPGMASSGDSPKDVLNVPVLIDGPGADGIDLSAPDRVARRLQLLADALRFPFKINAGVTAIDLMVASRPKGTTIEEWRNGPLAPSTFDLPFTVNDVERDFNWTRAPTADELKCRYLHAYDRGGSYAAAIAGLELPIGEPIHCPDGSVFEDPERLKQLIKAPGLVTIVVPENQDWRVPFLLNPAGLKFTAPKPMTTARLHHALKQGYAPSIVEAYTWPDHGRVLNGFYERVRDASLALDTDEPDDQAARNQSKVVRNVAIGLMGSEQNLKGKTGYDPMKRLSILGKASANIAYRLDQIGQATGRWPVAVDKDTVLYVSDNPNPAAAWPGGAKTWGRGFGQYKHEGSALLVDHVEYLNGSHYKGKAALLDPAEWTELLPTLTTPADTKAGH